MEFRILGPLEVLDDEGRPIPIHRGKEQALLAYLLLHRNELVASERLIDELWAERPPATAPKILQNAVSQLRKALGEGRLATRPPGYVLRLEPGELDLDRFERLAAEGRKTGDAERLREALAVWRGEPLANLRDELFAQRAALNLEEQRLAVLEDRIEADLAAGRHGELVSELEELARRKRSRPISARGAPSAQSSGSSPARSCRNWSAGSSNRIPRWQRRRAARPRGRRPRRPAFVDGGWRSALSPRCSSSAHSFPWG